MLSTMSNQPENENQQIEIVNSEEVRQSILAEIDATRQTIAELSEEELAEVAGGLNPFSITSIRNHFDAYGEHYQNLGQAVKGFGSSFSNIGSSFKNIYQTRAARRAPMAPEK
jgi:hypothetical protein